MTPLLKRWLKFNLVGAIGIGVQLATLALLASGFGVNYLAATAVAVETAVLHNFVWHERFTWSDRSGGGARALAGRLLRFHAGNGLVSLAGNLAVMRLLVGVFGVPAVAANVVAIAACSLLNFAIGEWLVFR
jgi:putative flippase GtrA